MIDLTKGKVSSVIIRFAAPMLLGNLFQQTYTIVDSIIVGKMIGDEALAAVGASFPIIFTLISFVIGIATGGTIVISQYYGAKDFKKVRKAIDTILIFIFFASILIMGVGIGFSRHIFVMLKLPQDVMPQAIIYLRTFLSGTILLFGYNGVSSILRGVGDSKTPLYFQAFAAVLNILLDLLFIGVFKWGIRGAAMATVISQGLAFIIGTYYVNKRHSFVHINVLKLKFDRKIFKQSFNIGVPSGLQQTFVALGMMALFRIVNNFGTVIIAAYSVAGRIDGLAMLPSMVFGQALSTYVGQNLGAGKIERVKKGLHFTLFFSSIVSLTITLVVFLFGRDLMSLFTKTPEVVEAGLKYLVIVSSCYIIFSIMFSLNGVMRGAGDTLIPMFITLFSLWVVRIPFAALLSGRAAISIAERGWNIRLPEFMNGHLGEVGIWWSVPIAWTLGSIASFFYYRTGNWKKKVVVSGTIIEE